MCYTYGKVEQSLQTSGPQYPGCARGELLVYKHNDLHHSPEISHVGPRTAQALRAVF